MIHKGGLGTVELEGVVPVAPVELDLEVVGRSLRDEERAQKVAECVNDEYS